jgi:hypothetical protein
MSNPAAKQWGDIDTSKLVISGQSCGGEEAVRDLSGSRQTEAQG